MYYIFEVISDFYFLRYKTNDLEFASQFLQTFKGKYLDKKFVMFYEVI